MGNRIYLLIKAATTWAPRMKTLEQRLGQRIAKQRKAVGLTQTQLAEKVDVQPETISRIETGRRTASLRLMATLSDAIELELHELFRLQHEDSPKDDAMTRLLWFASRLTPIEIEVIMDLGAAVLPHIRRSPHTGLQKETT